MSLSLPPSLSCYFSYLLCLMTQIEKVPNVVLQCSIYMHALLKLSAFSMKRDIRRHNLTRLNLTPSTFCHNVCLQEALSRSNSIASLERNMSHRTPEAEGAASQSGPKAVPRWAWWTDHSLVDFRIRDHSGLFASFCH